jgi:FkbM family methyltransferase
LSILRALRKTIYRLLGRTAASFIQRSHKRIKILFTEELTANEIALINSVSGLVEKDSVAVDVGAYIGAWTIRLSHLVGPSGIVVAFEPVPGNYQLLKKRIKRRGNILCLNIALSNKACFKEMFVPQYTSISSTAAIVDTADQIKNVELMQTIQIRANRLDNLAYSVLSDRRVSLIKCDAEGHENAILEGAKITIVKNRPVIVLEILREKWENDNPSKSHAAQLLKELGYMIIQIESGSILKNPRRFNRSNENFLFLPDDDSLSCLANYMNS